MGKPVIHRWLWASAALMVAAGLGVVSEAPAHASGTGQTIYDNFRDTGTGIWQGWQPPAQPPGTIESYPAVSADSANGSIHIDVVTSQGLYDIEEDFDGVGDSYWAKWEPPPQPPATPKSDPSATSYQIYSVGLPGGTIFFFQIYNGQLWWDSRFPDGDWSTPWTEAGVTMPSGTVSLAMTATGNSDNFTIQMLALTSSGTIWHNLLAYTGYWQGWQKPAQLPDGAKAIAAAGLTDGDTEFMAVAGNGLVYHTIRSGTTGEWQTWEPPVQPPAGWYDSANEYNLSAAADNAGNAQFVLWDTGTNGVTSIYHTIRAANGTWQSAGWGKPAMPPGNQNCAGSAAIPTFDTDSSFWDLHLDALCYS